VRLGKHLGRLEIPAEDLEAGLRSLFEELGQQVGPYDYGPVIKDYAPSLRQGLYYYGYGGIERLNVNGSTVDIYVYFRVDIEPAVLMIDAFVEGRGEPIITLANRYYVQAR